MRKTLIFVGVGLVLIAALSFFLFGKVLKKPGKAALQIASIPDARVLLNNEEKGTTPFYSKDLEAGEYLVKLIPLDPSGFVSWEEKINLDPNILTSINRQLGSDEDKSSGQIITLEKSSDSKKTFLSLVSLPGEALVKINDESKGFAPITEELSPAEYKITVSAPGYQEKIITASTVAGYKLNISVKLSREDMDGVAEATSSAGETEESEESEETEEEETKATPTPKATAKPEANAPDKPYVKILTTPTGWLRVRLGPSTTATEAAKLNTGETVPYLDEEENGWYKIEYEEGEEGWVSGVYAEVVE